MLVIRRRAGEAFFIGENIQVRIVEINAHRVVLGIEAPPEIPIVRQEIRQAMEQNQQAARGIPQKVAVALAAKIRQNPVL